MKKIPYSKQFIDQSDIDAVVDVLKSPNLTQGPKIDAFEQSIVDYTGAKYAVAVSSCTAGLHMSCIALDVGKKNNLITSPITFVSSANSAIYCGADVILSDIDVNTGCMKIEDLENTLKGFKNIKAVMPVHYSGNTVDMVSLKKLCNSKKISIIEDCAHALGSSYATGEKVGSCKYSDVAVFSFHPVKSITSGEGGVITTNNEQVYRKLLRLRSHGINKTDDKFVNNKNAFTGGMKNNWYYEMSELGYHYRITDIQSALGHSQMKKIEIFMKKRHQLVEKYDMAFKNEKKIALLTNNAKLSSNHLYVIKINFSDLKISRAYFQKKLSDKGILTQVHYIPLHLHPYLSKKLLNTSNCSESIKFYDQAISIPLYYDLSFQEQEFVIENIKELVS